MTFAFGIYKNLTPDYGRLRTYYESWDPKKVSINFYEIPARKCVESDFGIASNQYKFYPILL